MTAPEPRLVLVDADDRAIGEAGRDECHAGDGKLHRAFSLHVVTAGGGILLQRRAAPKPLWPGFWSNSCCSHPRVGEDIESAVRRRALEELGLHVEPDFLYKFQYQAKFENIGSENELCSVFIARCDDMPQPDPDEVSEWRYLDAAALDAEMAADPAAFTPWFKMQWRRLQGEFSDRIDAVAKRN